MAAVSIENHGSIYLVRADDNESDEALQEFIADNVGEHTMFGGALAVEGGYIENFAGGLLSEGFDVSLDGRPLALGGA